MKRTKIVCTIGPASETKAIIEQLVKSGLNVARLNFSHGTYKHHAMLVRNIRSVSKKLAQPVAILQDLQGPRIRIGDVAEEGIPIKSGQKITFVGPSVKISKKDAGNIIPIQYAELYKDLKAGSTILVEDGTITLKVESVKDKKINCVVRNGDLIKSHKGMNFPNTTINAPAVTVKDKKDLKFGLGQGVDFVALSFVKDEKDIKNLRKNIAVIEKKLGRGKNLKPGEQTETKIIAKIERPEALKVFDKILKEVDGIMVARGDLGLEIPIQNLPLIQKKIIRKCLQVSKPVIVATQMLDSMTRTPVPTRAEVTDVANAILDGTDAIMLSGESATGKYPVKAVQVMNKIASSVEATEMKKYQAIEEDLKKTGGVTEAVAFAAQDIAEEVGAKYIVCATMSGFTARSISKFRSKARVIAMAPTEKVQNQLNLSWGVEAYTIPFTTSFIKLIPKIIKELSKNKLVKKGDKVVIAASHPLGHLNQTNLVKVETI